MNFTGQVLWKRSVMGAACARAIMGKPPRAVPVAAAARKRRREAGLGADVESVGLGMVVSGVVGWNGTGRAERVVFAAPNVAQARGMGQILSIGKLLVNIGADGVLGICSGYR